MSKATDFLNEAGATQQDFIVTLQVKMRVMPKMSKTADNFTNKEVEELAQKALMKAIPEEDMKGKNVSMYVISVAATGSKKSDKWSKDESLRSGLRSEVL